MMNLYEVDQKVQVSEKYIDEDLHGSTGVIVEVPSEKYGVFVDPYYRVQMDPTTAEPEGATHLFEEVEIEPEEEIEEEIDVESITAATAFLKASRDARK